MPQKQNAQGRIENFDSSHWESSSSLQSRIDSYLANNEIKLALTTAFELSPNDSFKYWAHMPVTLSEMQHIVNLGDVNGLHHWYDPADNSNSTSTPTSNITDYEKPFPTDIDAYTAIFSPSSSSLSALRTLEAGGKQSSIRRRVGSYLLSTRHTDTSLSSIPRRRAPHFNPSLVFWVWYCRAVAWCGPVPLSSLRSVNHPVLPVLMHHFGCVVPTWEALEILRIVTNGGKRTIHEIGSGNGYWAFMLRRHGLKVHAVDNGQSVFRTNWIGDTIDRDAIEYLRMEKGAKEGLLLMVYPVVSGEFTRRVLDQWEGDEVIVAGTQNGNGYTGFKDVTMGEWMERERPGWDRVAQIALPSFPGKDEALWIFRRGKREGEMEEGEESKIDAEDTAAVQQPGRNAKANAKKKAKKKSKALFKAQSEDAVTEPIDRAN